MEREIYIAAGAMSFYFFVDVYWSSDKSKVAVLTCGNPGVRLAYDMLEARNLAFNQLEADVATTIRNNYHLKARKNPKSIFEWACSDEGRDAFYEKVPAFAR